MIDAQKIQDLRRAFIAELEESDGSSVASTFEHGERFNRLVTSAGYLEPAKVDFVFDELAGLYHRTFEAEKQVEKLKAELAVARPEHMSVIDAPTTSDLLITNLSVETVLAAIELKRRELSGKISHITALELERRMKSRWTREEFSTVAVKTLSDYNSGEFSFRDALRGALVKIGIQVEQ